MKKRIFANSKRASSDSDSDSKDSKIEFNNKESDSESEEDQPKVSFAALPRKQAPKPISKDFASFEKHTKGIGSKILFKMGYRPGQGLGKQGEGIAEPVQVKLRPSGMGIGHGGFDEKVQKEETEKPIQSWQKSNNRVIKRKEIYKTSLQLLKDDESKPNQVDLEIIDMTGPVSKTTKLSELNNEIKIDSKCPELVYNLGMILKMSEDNLLNLSRKRKQHLSSHTARLNEIKDIKHNMQIDEVNLKRLEFVKALVHECRNIYKANLIVTDPLLVNTLYGKQMKTIFSLYKEDADRLNLEAFFSIIMTPVLRKYLSDWNVLAKPYYGYSILSDWADLLGIKGTQSTDTVMRPFDSMLYLTWLPVVRQAINNHWDATIPDSVVDLVERYDNCSFMPKWIISNIVHQLVLPKIFEAIDNWNFKTRGWKIHTIIFPWLNVLQSVLSELFDAVQIKLSEYYRKWLPSDPSGLECFQKWSKVFDESNIQYLTQRAIIPALNEYLRKNFEVNPTEQDIEPLMHVLTWNRIIPHGDFSDLIQEFVLNQWLEILWAWVVNEGADLEEITVWYQVWKQLFSENDCLSLPSVKESLKTGLDMMNQGVSANRPTKFIPTTTVQPIAEKHHAKEVEFTFKEYVEELCEEANIEFVPLYRQTISGFDMFRIGSLTIYIEEGVIYGKMGENWEPMSVEEAIDNGKIKVK